MNRVVFACLYPCKQLYHCKQSLEKQNISSLFEECKVDVMGDGSEDPIASIRVISDERMFIAGTPFFAVGTGKDAKYAKSEFRNQRNRINGLNPFIVTADTTAIDATATSILYKKALYVSFDLGGALLRSSKVANNNKIRILATLSALAGKEDIGLELFLRHEEIACPGKYKRNAMPASRMIRQILPVNPAPCAEGAPPRAEGAPLSQQVCGGCAQVPAQLLGCSRAAPRTQEICKLHQRFLWTPLLFPDRVPSESRDQFMKCVDESLACLEFSGIDERGAPTTYDLFSGERKVRADQTDRFIRTVDRAIKLAYGADFQLPDETKLKRGKPPVFTLPDAKTSREERCIVLKNFILDFHYDPMGKYDSAGALPLTTMLGLVNRFSVDSSTALGLKYKDAWHFTPKCLKEALEDNQEMSALHNDTWHSCCFCHVCGAARVSTKYDGDSWTVCGRCDDILEQDEAFSFNEDRARTAGKRSFAMPSWAAADLAGQPQLWTIPRKKQRTDPAETENGSCNSVSDRLKYLEAQNESLEAQNESHVYQALIAQVLLTHNKALITRQKALIAQASAAAPPALHPPPPPPEGPRSEAAAPALDPALDPPPPPPFGRGSEAAAPALDPAPALAPPPPSALRAAQLRCATRRVIG